MASVKSAKVVTSMEFSRMLDARAGGNEILLAIADSMALMLRFEVKGRATVGGVEYVREGGKKPLGSPNGSTRGRRATPTKRSSR